MGARDCLDKVLGLGCVGIWAATAVATGGLSVGVEALAAAGIGGIALGKHFLDLGKGDLGRTIQAALPKIEEAHRRGTATSGYSGDDINCAFQALERHFDAIVPTHAELAQCGTNPEAVADLLVGRLGEGEKGKPFANSAQAQSIVRGMVRDVYAVLSETPEHFARVQPAVARELLEQTRTIRRIVEHIRDAVDRLPAEILAGIGDRDALVAELGMVREKFRATETLIADFLRRMVGQDVPPEQFAATLYANMERWRDAVAQVEALARSANLAPELAGLRERADSARREERVDEFWSLIEAIDSIEQRNYDRVEREWKEKANEFAARREDLLRSKAGKRDAAIATFRLAEAAAAIAEIVDLETPDAETRFEALRRVQGEWYMRGRDRGLNLDLDMSIEIARLCVARARDAYQRGETLNDLGTALATLGERESSAERLEQAVAAFFLALEEWTRQRVPLGWARTQNNLGAVLQTLGQRESGTARLEQAVAAYLAALKERTRERVPLQWAATQNNLGNALTTLGERESGTTRLKQAVSAYRAALQESARELVPLQWAATHANLGNALANLGEREIGTARFYEAVEAYRAALEEWTRERVPLQWAGTQNNLGAVLRALGARENGTAQLEQAVAAYHAALEERTRERVPFQWATTQNNLGNVLATLGERESDTARLEQAVEAYHAALEEWTRERVPLDWALTRGNEAAALLALFGKSNDPTQLDAALAAVDSALEVYRDGQAAYDIGKAEELQAKILEAMGR